MKILDQLSKSLKSKNLDLFIKERDVIIEKVFSDISLRNYELELTLNKETATVTYGQLMLALIMMPLNFLSSKDIELSDLFLPELSSNPVKLFNVFINNFIQNNLELNKDTLQETITSILELNAKLMYKVNEVKGNTVNLYELFTMMDKDKELSDIIKFEIDESLQYHDMEASISEQFAKLVTKLADHGNNCYINLLRSVSPKQFQQVMINIGLKPDLYGNIYPIPINTSFIRGLRNERDYFINAMGARKALVVNASSVRHAGYLTRKLTLLIINQRVSEIVDCKTEDYLPIDIDNQKSLDKFDKRFYYSKATKQLSVINKHTDTKLIGKKILLRSPTTCSLPGNDICQVCFGNLFKLNDMHPSLTGGLFLTNQIIQNLLSSKHLLMVNASKINLPSNVMQYFELHKDILINNQELLIKIDEILTDEDTNKLYIEKFSLIQNGEEIEISLDDNELLLDPLENLLGVIKPEVVYSIPLDSEVFRLNIENTELTTPLKKLLKLIENEEKLNEFPSISMLILELTNLLDKSNLDSNAISLELILRELIRDTSDIQNRPHNFKDPDVITILKLSNALLHNPSLTISLAFERIKYIIENNIFDKHGDSVLDTLF